MPIIVFVALLTAIRMGGAVANQEWGILAWAGCTLLWIGVAAVQEVRINRLKRKEF